MTGIRYGLFCHGGRYWAEICRELREENIGSPVFWLGDHTHNLRARKYFGEGIVFELDDLRFKAFSEELVSKKVPAGYQEFIRSDEYKDIWHKAEKMMDRVDDFGTFNRNDRELQFKAICLFALELVERTEPDILLMTDSPHSYPQYIIYRLCCYKDIPALQFKTFDGWAPAVGLYNQLEGSYVDLNKEINKDTFTSDDLIEGVFRESSLRCAAKISSDFIPDYIRLQHREIGTNVSRFIRRVSGGIKSNSRRFLTSAYRVFKSDYYPLIPSWPLLVVTELLPASKRRKLIDLEHKYSKDIGSIRNHVRPFVYFPLHYEPERTTNPDGGNFTDQIDAILSLRSCLDDDIDIVVKEHPSQLKDAMFGHRGRSPLTYRLLSSIKGIELVSHKMSSLELIRESILVATITGTVGLEAALTGKRCLIFGHPPYKNCPNVYHWESLASIDEILSQKVYSYEEVIEWMVEYLRKYFVLGTHTPGWYKYWSSRYKSIDFSCERVELKQAMKTVFSRIKTVA